MVIYNNSKKTNELTYSRFNCFKVRTATVENQSTISASPNHRPVTGTKSIIKTTITKIIWLKKSLKIIPHLEIIIPKV
jgi:hypothetical protein